MSSALLLTRQTAVCRPQSVRRSSAAPFFSRPKPFSGTARRVVVKAAEPNVTEDDLQQLLEGEELDDDIEDEVIELDQETLDAIEAAEEFISSYDSELMYEVDVATTEDAREREVLEQKALEAVSNLLEGPDVDPEQVAIALAVAGPEVLDGEAVVAEDVQSSLGFRKYDEQEENAISADERAAMQDYKLTKQELANLVPQDWDTINIDWFTNKREDNIPLPEFKLNFLWQEKNIAVAVDQVYSRGQVSPLTEYFFWPRKDAWEELKTALESKPWVSERDKVILLNRLTEVINFWQDEQTKHTLDEAKTNFPDCAFAGA